MTYEELAANRLRMAMKPLNLQEKGFMFPMYKWRVKAILGASKWKEGLNILVFEQEWDMMEKVGFLKIGEIYSYLRKGGWNELTKRP